MIGEEVRRRRKELGLTGAQLAIRADMAPSAVSQIETGKRTPNSTSVLKLSSALGVEVADLFPKGQTALFTQPPSEVSGEWEGPIPNSLEEALECAESPTRLMSLPRKEFEGLYANLTREEVVSLNRDLRHERKLLKPILDQWQTMPPSEERSLLCALWRESWARSMVGAREAEKTNDMYAAQELSTVA
jgi:transcriptional regulator with XRE-family HTH domain